jgi:asparagine synthase (glutamine-hydrolysing)
MCGIVGFTGKIENSKEIITLMSDKIIHRGPNSSGFHINDDITLGFRRLSIIDLDHGSQPMYNEDDSIVIIFNGEIYNHKTLREDLKNKGHIFKNNADTEVLLHLYEEYGANMLEHLRGMFAFAIYDTNKKEFFAARDFFGIKPFYYTLVNNNLVFASEIKCILEYPEFEKQLNIEALENYLTFQYSVLPETFFKNIFKLLPGHYMTFKNNELEITKYFDPKFNAVQKTLEETVTEIDKAVQDSILLHKMSDVEVGSFLSSGVDSSYIAASFKGEKTFTVGFDYQQYNEVDYAKKLSEKIDVQNHSKLITKEDYFEVFSKVLYHMDEPLADPAAVALYFVSELASKHVTVALSGEGADEFFGGYNIYKEPINIKPLTNLPKPIRTLLGKIAAKIPFRMKGKNFFIRGSKTVEQRFIGNANIFTKEEREIILKSPTVKYKPEDVTKPLYDMVKDYDDITKMQHIDIHLWMVGDILLKADKMSMAHSLEVRVPLVDKEVFKVASCIPTEFRVNKKDTKYTFRMAANKYLPQEVSSKKKLGFPVPIRIWLKEDKYYNMVKEAFLSEVSNKYFNSQEIIKLLDSHKQDKEDNSRKIWTIYTFLVWHKQYFN